MAPGACCECPVCLSAATVRDWQESSIEPGTTESKGTGEDSTAAILLDNNYSVINGQLFIWSTWAKLEL